MWHLSVFILFYAFGYCFIHSYVLESREYFLLFVYLECVHLAEWDSGRGAFGDSSGAGTTQRLAI